jgi:hypothetical protein
MLSFSQKRAVIFLFSIIGSFANKEFWQGFYISKNQQKFIDTIVQECENLGVSIGMEDNDFEILKNDIKKGIYKIECIHNRELQEAKKKYRSKTSTVKQEDLFDLVEIAMEPCNGCARNPRACKLRKIFKKMNIEPFDYDKENRCEYCVKKKEAVSC